MDKLRYGDKVILNVDLATQGLEQGAILEVCRVDHDGYALAIASNGNMCSNVKGFFTLVNPPLELGQTWISSEGIEVKIIAHGKDYVRFSFSVGGKPYDDEFDKDYFLNEFRYKWK